MAGDDEPPRAAAPARQAVALPPAVTVADLMSRYACEVSPTKAGKRWEVTRLRTWPETFPLFAGPVAELTPAALATWRDARLRSVKGSTVNRELNLVSAVCNKALREWRIPELTINPVRAIQRPTNPRPRTRMIIGGRDNGPGEAARLGPEDSAGWCRAVDRLDLPASRK